MTTTVWQPLTFGTALIRAMRADNQGDRRHHFEGVLDPGCSSRGLQALLLLGPFLHPRKIRSLEIAEVLKEFLCPPYRFSEHGFQSVRFVRKPLQIVVLEVCILEHPCGASALLLQDNGYTLSQFCHVGQFIKMT